MNKIISTICLLLFAILSTSGDPYIVLTHPETGTSSAKFITDVKFSPDYGTIATCGFPWGSVFFWDPSTGNFKGKVDGTENIGNIVYSQNGKYIAAWGYRDLIHIIDVENQNLLYAFNVIPIASPEWDPDIWGYKSLGSCVFSSDGEKLFIAYNGSVYVWDIIHQKRINKFDYPYDGELVFTGHQIQFLLNQKDLLLDCGLGFMIADSVTGSIIKKYNDWGAFYRLLSDKNTVVTGRYSFSGNRTNYSLFNLSKNEFLYDTLVIDFFSSMFVFSFDFNYILHGRGTVTNEDLKQVLSDNDIRIDSVSTKKTVLNLSSLYQIPQFDKKTQFLGFSPNNQYVYLAIGGDLYLFDVKDSLSTILNAIKY